MSDPIDRRRVARVVAKLSEMTGEMPSSDGGGGKGGHSDRVASLAFRHTIHPDDDMRGEHSDVATRELAQISELEQAIMVRARRGGNPALLLFRLDLALRRCELTDRQAEGLRVRADDSGAGWCQSHYRVNAQVPPRTPGGRLCRWCEDWVRALNDPDGDWAHTVDFPPIEMVRADAQGQSPRRFIPQRKARR